MAKHTKANLGEEPRDEITSIFLRVLGVRHLPAVEHFFSLSKVGALVYSHCSDEQGHHGNSE